MLEVEIRGRLTKAAFDALKKTLDEKGKHSESHTREMIRLYDYPGFDEDPIKREVDIRLRDTDGKCEIMVKTKADAHNVARHELSLKLADSNLDTAKAVLKALGYSKGLWMHRKKDVYEYSGVEWSLVEAPQEYYYFEAEKTAENQRDIQKVQGELEQAAAALDLSVFSPEEYKEFIEELSAKVNKVIEW